MSAPPDIRIRAARPEDAPAIRRVQEDSIRGLGPAAYGPTEIESWAAGLGAQAYANAINSGKETILVAVRGDRVVGFGSLKPLEISALYIAPDQSRQGIGRALLRRLEDLARDEGRRSVRLTATLLGEPFYRAQAYRVVDRRKHPTRGGVPIEAVVMEKTLSPS